jgi:hypothetical protein
VLPSPTKVASSVKRTDETNNLSTVCRTNYKQKFPMMGNQQALDPAHIVNGKGTVAVHEVPAKWSYNQEGMPPPIVSC